MFVVLDSLYRKSKASSKERFANLAALDDSKRIDAKIDRRITRGKFLSPTMVFASVKDKPGLFGGKKILSW